MFPGYPGATATAQTYMNATPSHQMNTQQSTLLAGGPHRLDKYCKDMIQSLAFGMEGLQQFVSKEQNINANVQIIKVFDPKTGTWQLEQKNSGNNFDNQSVRSDVSYKMSAIGEMNNFELNQLHELKERNMKRLEDEYFEATKDVKTSQEIINEKYENFETRERQKEPSINFPTYGRGLKPPGIDLNTFMVNAKLCEDKAVARQR
jgi:hypothetical protein